MAEECVSLPDSSDVSRSWRRISTGKLNLMYSEDRVLPSYLRASTGSCHDLCKYGRRYEPENKERGSTPRMTPMKLSREKIPSQSLDSPLMKSSTLAKRVVNPPLSCRKCDPSGFDVKSVAGDVKKREASTGLSNKGMASVNSKNAPKEMKRNTVSSPESCSTSFIARKQKTSQSSKTVFLPPGRASSSPREIVELKKRAALTKLRSVASKGSVAQHNRRENSVVVENKIGVPKADTKKVVLSRRATFSKTLHDRSGFLNLKKGSSLNAPPLSNRKEKTTSEANKSGLKAKQAKRHEDLVEEKTLHVIKMETEKTIVESIQNERCVIDSPTTDTYSSTCPRGLSQRKKRQEESECEEESSGNQEIEEEEEDLYGDDESLPDGKRVLRQRKNRAFSSEDTVKDKANKLKSKRGKISYTASVDTIPRRLKFKRGRVLAEDDSTPKPSGRRSFKTKGKDLNNEEHKPRSVNVALRHQEVQRKRESRVVLFNNVIEETANKLVETRKSKVKALVGAFETVISLQEIKPCTNITGE